MSEGSSKVSPGIGSLNEKPLHIGLREWSARPGDRFEVDVDGFVVDILRDGLVVEIQTRSFASIKRKLLDLTSLHRVQLVYPIALEKWIVKLPKDEQETESRRKSPKRGAIEDVFVELVSFPRLLENPRFCLDVVFITEEDVRRYDRRRGWRRKGWLTEERRLLDVLDHRTLREPDEVVAILPSDLEDPFTTSDLAGAMGRPRGLAQKAAYCLREMGAITQVGKRDRSVLYARSADHG